MGNPSPKYISWESVVTMDNLIESYHNVRRGKKKRTNAIWYHVDHMVKLKKLKDKLDNGTYKIGKLSRFRVYEPKEREVIADSYEDKIVQDLISKRVLRPLLGPKVINDNYASQPGKGTHVAVDRLVRYMRIHAKSVEWTSRGWVMIGDITKFFYMIDHTVCWELIEKLPVDKRLMDLIHAQIEICTADINPYTDTPGKGLCIGFQTSQWLAVYYLNKLDHFIKEALGIKCYGRYMDDFYLIHEDRKYLEQCYQAIERFVSSMLKVQLNAKSHIHPFSQGICFLGYHATYNERTHDVDVAIRSKSINKMMKRARRQRNMIAQGRITPADAAGSLQSWHAYAMHGETEKSINAFNTAKDILRLNSTAAKEYHALCNDWTNLDSDGFFKLNTTEDADIRDADGFMVLWPKKKSKREVWAEKKQEDIKKNASYWAQENLMVMLDIGLCRRAKPKPLSKKAKAKRKARKAEMKLLRP